MKALFIGGTGVISTSVVKLAVQKGWDVTLLNRGQTKTELPQGVRVLHADARDTASVNAVLGDETFDVVAQFIGLVPAHVAADIETYKNRTKQYIYISSTSVYQRPSINYLVTESTPLVNPNWQYARDKIACEEMLMKAHREFGFPVTIVRPGHTYCDKVAVPAVRGSVKSGWQIIDRIRSGKPVIIQGDGTSLWTMTHASDFAKGFVGLMGNIRALGNAFHITSDEVMTWNQIYQLFARALDMPLHAVHVASDFLVNNDDGMDIKGTIAGDKNDSVVLDNTKIKSFAPEFVCTVSMSQGICDAVRNMVANEDCQAPDPQFDAWCDKVIAAQQLAAEFMQK